MKNVLKLLAVPAALFAATPAFAASDFTGPRVEAGVVVTDTNVTDTKTTYGLNAGYDFALTDRVRLGVEATSNDLFQDNREYGAGGRLGFVVTPDLMLYGKVGYVNREVYSTKLDGITYGGGAELALNNNLYLKGEYRRSDFENEVTGDTGLLGLGIRF